MSESKFNILDKNEVGPDWGAVFQRIEALCIPEDQHERADDIAKNFSSGRDIEMFGKALHDVLVPDVQSTPTERAIKSVDPNSGEVVRVFLEPKERSIIFDLAADYIRKLSEMRASRDDDEQFLIRAASVVALAITLAHSYENGNGRLARMIAELVRYGSRNKDDLILLGTERDVSQKQKNGFRIDSYRQFGNSIDRGESDYDVMRIAASPDTPLEKKEEYVRKASSTFSSPHGWS